MQCVLGDLFRQDHGKRINLGSVWLVRSKTAADGEAGGHIENLSFGRRTT